MGQVNEDFLAADPPEQALRKAGDEPIPGYRLVELLGRGGFGEVWKCEAPGGLSKAIKFVDFVEDGICESQDNSAAAEEQAGLQRIKAIRHPFLLSIERVEAVEGVLLAVMELADRNLHAVQREYRDGGLSGIPREELLSYLWEAAEVLDIMALGHGLQHLDIKPQNLFLVGNHVKVGDFGLVHTTGNSDTRRSGAGLTPQYAAPEVWEGAVSRHSDQYSLAVLYQEMLTGRLPFEGRNSRQLMIQHLTLAPDLTGLPDQDRAAVARALSKDPEQRFPSCLDFLKALVEGYDPSAEAPKALPGHVRRRLPRPQLASGAVAPSAQVPTSGEARGADRTGETDHEPSARKGGPDTSRPSCHSAQPEAVKGSIPPNEEDASTGPPTADRPALPLDAGTFLPGYEFLQYLGQRPLGDLWNARDPQGRNRQVLWLPTRCNDSQAVARLQALRHPALLETKFIRSPSGCLALVMDCFEQTLADRFEACRAGGSAASPGKSCSVTWAPWRRSWMKCPSGTECSTWG